MSKKIFWALCLLAAYLAIMLSGNEHYISDGFNKVYSFCYSLLEDVEVKIQDYERR